MTALSRRRLSRVATDLQNSPTGGALVLLAATLVALVWANLPGDTYQQFWHSHVTIDVSHVASLDLDLRHWVNDGLMAVFFFVVTLEVKRELALGDLRDRRRATVPTIAAVVGLVVPALIFIGITSSSGMSGEAVGAWGVVVSTDTAFVLGLLAVAGSAAPPHLRTFLLTLAIIDDIGALGVIAIVYTDHLEVAPMVVAAVALAGVVVLRRLRVWRGPSYLVLSMVVWLAVLESGVHATLAGVLIGLLLPVFPPAREQVEAAEAEVAAFARTPTPGRARGAMLGVSRAVSVNERLQELFGPFLRMVVVPVFALANAGVALDRQVLADAATSPLTWSIIIGLVVGKTVGIHVATLAAVRVGLGTLPPGVQRRHVLAGASLSGIGFTISLFIVDLALTDPASQGQARIGVLLGSLTAAVLSMGVFASVRRRDALRPADAVRLPRPVASGRDHVVGTDHAPFELVAYASFVFSAAGRAVGVVDQVRAELGAELRFVYRHKMPPGESADAHLAAEASEEAARQGRFWPMHDALAARYGRLDCAEIRRCAAEAGLNLQRLDEALRLRTHKARVDDDVLDAEALHLQEEPRFFVNGTLYEGPLDADALVAALTGLASDRPRRSSVGAG